MELQDQTTSAILSRYRKVFFMCWCILYPLCVLIQIILCNVAIEEASVLSSPNNCVSVDGGDFVTSDLYLKSHLVFRIETGSRLLAAVNKTGLALLHVENVTDIEVKHFSCFQPCKADCFISAKLYAIYLHLLDYRGWGALRKCRVCYCFIPP